MTRISGNADGFSAHGTEGGGGTDTGSGDEAAAGFEAGSTIGVALPDKTSENWVLAGKLFTDGLKEAGFKAEVQYAPCYPLGGTANRAAARPQEDASSNLALTIA